MPPKQNPIAGEPLLAEEVYSEIIYDGPHGPLCVLPAWGQKSVPEMYFRKLGFKNLAPTKRSKLVDLAHDPEEDQTDFEGFSDNESNAGGTIVKETADTFISGAGGGDGLRFPGVAGTPPVNTGEAESIPLATQASLRVRRRYVLSQSMRAKLTAVVARRGSEVQSANEGAGAQL